MLAGAKSKKKDNDNGGEERLEKKKLQMVKWAKKELKSDSGLPNRKKDQLVESSNTETVKCIWDEAAEEMCIYEYM